MWTLLNRTQRVNYGLILLVAFMYFSSGSMMLYLQRFFMAIDADEKTSGILVAFAVIPFVLFSMVSG
ncbi:MAG: hypothetical protein D6B27_08400, partial [Gammaproteobacteria bacterium]